MSDATDTYLGEETLESTVVDNFLDLNVDESINGVLKKTKQPSSNPINDTNCGLDGQLTEDVRDTVQNERGNRITLDRTRDQLLTTFGKETLSDRYLMPGESLSLIHI